MAYCRLFLDLTEKSADIAAKDRNKSHHGERVPQGRVEPSLNALIPQRTWDPIARDDECHHVPIPICFADFHFKEIPSLEAFLSLFSYL